MSSSAQGRMSLENPRSLNLPGFQGETRPAAESILVRARRTAARAAYRLLGLARITGLFRRVGVAAGPGAELERPHRWAVPMSPVHRSPNGRVRYRIYLVARWARGLR